MLCCKQCVPGHYVYICKVLAQWHLQTTHAALIVLQPCAWLAHSPACPSETGNCQYDHDGCFKLFEQGHSSCVLAKTCKLARLGQQSLSDAALQQIDVALLSMYSFIAGTQLLTVYTYVCPFSVQPYVDLLCKRPWAFVSCQHAQPPG